MHFLKLLFNIYTMYILFVFTNKKKSSVVNYLLKFIFFLTVKSHCLQYMVAKLWLKTWVELLYKLHVYIPVFIIKCMYKSWNRQFKLIGYVNILGEKRVKNIEIFILSKLKKKNNPFVLGQIIDNYKNKQ